MPDFGMPFRIPPRDPRRRSSKCSQSPLGLRGEAGAPGMRGMQPKCPANTEAFFAAALDAVLRNERFAAELRSQHAVSTQSAKPERKTCLRNERIAAEVPRGVRGRSSQKRIAARTPERGTRQESMEADLSRNTRGRGRIACSARGRGKSARSAA